MEFLDRQRVMARLKRALSREKTQFIVIYGRRRVGKSTLIKKMMHIERGDVYFLADQTAESSQRQLFADMVANTIPDFNQATYLSWEVLFRSLNRQLKKRVLICLDEFPYLVKSCPSLPSVIQKLLDEKELKFDLILSGSSQQMMQGFVLDSTEPLYGHADEIIRLRPIPYNYTTEALGCNAEDAVREYSIWGGIPRYWELRNDYGSMDAAIDALLLDPDGALYEEPTRLLRDEMRDTIQASTILSFIGNGASRLSEIASRAEKKATDITPLLKRLRELGFIDKHIPFGDDEKKSKKGIYSVSDPLLRFHYRFVQPYRSALEMGNIAAVMDIFRQHENEYVSRCWEWLCQRYVTGGNIHGILYNTAVGWWGEYYDEQEKKYKTAELDVVAESLDKKHLLIGECKWKDEENFTEVMDKLSYIAERVPFKGNHEVHPCLFIKDNSFSSNRMPIFYPEDIMERTE